MSLLKVVSVVLSTSEVLNNYLLNALVFAIVALNLQVRAKTKSSSASEAMYLVIIRECSRSVILIKCCVFFKSFSPVPQISLM